MALTLCLAMLQADCPAFRPSFANPSLGNSVLALSAEGPGGELTVAGQFTPFRVERWDGERWSIPASGLPGTVRALARFDHGSGLRTVAGGEFGGVSGSYVAEWSGTDWIPLGGGPDSTVFALATFDDGAGSQLYAGGQFDTTGGAPIARLARWNGSTWSAAGGSFDGIVRALAVHDDGSGPALYAGGDFTHVGGIPVAHVARWNGSAWSAVGMGTDGLVRALASYQGALYAGGSFATAGTTAAAHVARWDGVAWQALGSGADADVHALAVHDAGAGPELYAGGDFLVVGGLQSRAVAAWDGASWSACAAGVGGVVRCLTSWDPGSGAELYAGGNFKLHEGTLGLNLSRWTGTSWRAVSEGLQGISPHVASVIAYDDGNGPRTYVGGGFVDAGGRTVRSLGRWTGSAWESIGGISGASENVFDLKVNDLGGGRPELIVAGSFTSASGVPCANVARWNGAAFAPIGNGPGAPVIALATEGSGTSARIYAGGNGGFPFPGFPNAIVARWSGGAWEPLGAMFGLVRALEVFDDGTGPALYAGGMFSALSASTCNIARWNGSAWVAVGNPTAPYNPGVYDLMSWDDGTGPALYVGGWFATLGGLPVPMLGRWNGTSWSSTGYFESYDDTAFGLAQFDDGTGRGRRLFAAGDEAIHVLDEGTWSVVAGLGSNDFATLTAIEASDETGRELWTGGQFNSAGGVGTRGLVVLRACDETGRTFCHGDGSEGVCPCGNQSATGSRQGCAHSFGQGGALRARGQSSLTHDTLAIEGSSMTNSSALYFQGRQRIAPVPFGDGIKCTAGPFVRLGTKSNVAGASRYPDAGDPALSVRGMVTAPGTRYYQVRYRNAAAFCTPETFNYTNAVTIEWGA